MGGKSLFSDVELLRRLALSESGFVFDPVTGNSYTANDTGLALLKLLQRGLGAEEAVAEICASYEIDARDAARDVLDFVAQLNVAFK
jgi:hypothetical protein